MKRVTSQDLGVVKSATPVNNTVEDQLWKKGKLREDNLGSN